jgi:hypothetical protein
MIAWPRRSHVSVIAHTVNGISGMARASKIVRSQTGPQVGKKDERARRLCAGDDTIVTPWSTRLHHSQITA